MELRARAARISVVGLLAACGIWLVVNQVRIVVFGGGSIGFLSSRWAHVVVLLVCSGLCLARGAVDRTQRPAWLLIGLAMLAWSAGEVYYTAALWSDTSPPLPSIADYCYLWFGPLGLAGLVVLQRRRGGPLPRVMWTDGLTTALSLGALSAALLFHRVLVHDSGSPLAAGITFFYPLVDTILVGAVLASLARIDWRPDPVWILLGAGLLGNWLADTMFLVSTAAGTYQEGSWSDAGWWGGFYLIALAAWQLRGQVSQPRRDAGPQQIAVPLVFGSLGLGILVYGCAERISWLGIGLAAASVLGVMARLVLAFGNNAALLRRSRHEALTDPLTGLANRRALTERMEAVFASGGPAPSLLVLCDLDGFKAYNDRFGHPAGDALLVRLGDRLRSAVGDDGAAFRMGGDEFCALLPAPFGEREQRLQAVTEALTETGNGYAVGCSWGAIDLPDQAGSLSEALGRVDDRMYADKRRRQAPDGTGAAVGDAGELAPVAGFVG